MKNAIVIGGGLAGLIAAIRLARNEIPCILIEKKVYPFHRVCGEYISNETLPFLLKEGLFPHEFDPPRISRFQLSSIRGKAIIMPLDLGGFGISRFAFDHYLYQKAVQSGVKILQNTEVSQITYANEKFQIEAGVQNFEADIVIGAFGKRSKLDVKLNRSFIKKRSPYLGVKYHIKYDQPLDLIALHNFPGGYCGISNVENDTVNLCYLSHRENLRKHGEIEGMESQVLHRNPLLKYILCNSERIFDKPEVINEVSFETKLPVEHHVFMIGDAAGMITPLCGNGMAMAIHSAKLLSDLTVRFCTTKNFERDALEKEYTRQWKNIFANRLWAGRQIQRLFGSLAASDLAVNLAIYSRPVAQVIIKNTHGSPF